MGVGFLSLLGLVFIFLKLTGFINWSWWLVTLPIWGGVAGAILFNGILFLCIYLIDKERK